MTGLARALRSLSEMRMAGWMSVIVGSTSGTAAPDTAAASIAAKRPNWSLNCIVTEWVNLSTKFMKRIRCREKVGSVAVRTVKAVRVVSILTRA